MKNFEIREAVSTGTPVITVSDLEHPWVYVFVPETEIGKVKIGQKAYITADSFPGRKFEGEIARIYDSAEFTPKNIQTKEERVYLVFRVKVRIFNTELALKPGMPVDVEIVGYGK